MCNNAGAIESTNKYLNLERNCSGPNFRYIKTNPVKSVYEIFHVRIIPLIVGNILSLGVR